MNPPSPSPDPPVPILIRLLRWRVLVALAVVVFLLAGGATQGQRAFRRWKERRLARAATAHLEHGKVEEAVLAARHVLGSNPNNAEACRVMAELARLYSPSDAIAWRARVAALEPDNLRARLDWAGEAIARGETALANEVLLGVAPADRVSVEYHEIAAGLAIAARRFQLADLHLRAALKRDPKNSRLRLNLATLELGSTDRAIREQAKAALDVLRKDPSVRLPALRALLAAALQSNEPSRAISLGRELASEPGATFRDKLLHLGALFRARSPDAPSRLAELKAAATPSGADVGEMLAWMNANGMAAHALAWAFSLPSGITFTMPVPIVLAEAYSLVGNWNGLLQMISSTSWAEFEPLRLAIVARAFKETGNDIGAQFQWRAAVRLASSQIDMLNTLVRFAVSWGWQNEAEQILWELAERPTPPRGVLETLYRHYQARRDTKGLLRITRRIVQLDPADLVARNNLALFSLLLDEDPGEAFKSIRDLCADHPKNAAFVSTYALALLHRGRTDEGLKAMGALDPKALRVPGVAFYYGLLLADHGDKARAREFLDLGAVALLLPQEEALAAEARRKIQ